MAERKSRPAAAPAELDDMNEQLVDPKLAEIDGGSVQLVMPRDGSGVFFAPPGFDRMTARQKRVVRRICTTVAARRELAQEIEAMVPEARAEGSSWGVIGWCTGMTAEGARQRWGVDNTPTE
jgi:hypothetical protein